MSETNPFPTALSEQQLLQKAFNEDTERLRVDSGATITMQGQMEVAISDTDGDSVKVGDASGNYLKINTDGSINTSGTSIITGSITVPISLPSVSSATQTSVSSSATSVQLLAANSSRNMATFDNDSTAAAYLKFGTTASTTSYTVYLGPGDYYELPLPVYTGRIDCIWASANGAMRITEY